ncbi:META domain-containing protein [Psychroserpens jangbogonensis]|uniref:META domain-containing protein n=1 Tax=Psychroserpens jangbogonensis TaxID=1484460 RepID=UPI0006903D83|nr:META domain-containing protein [Psychroserpens jangbogonensis]
MKHLAILISMIILKSCGSSQDVASAANTTDMITNETISGTYVLEQLDTTNVTDELTLEFDSKTNKVSGFAGCNRFFGTYTTDGNTISLSELGATRMMCEDEANKIELKMFQTLAKVNAYELTNGKLSLKNDEDILITANEKMMSKSRQGETINITYRASTRGFFEAIWIEGSVLKYTNDRNLIDIERRHLSDEQLSELMALYNDLDVESIPSLEPPSKTFQHDAAAMGVLKINVGETIYTSNGFDHGNPPKPIALFVDKVLSIKETMTKQ